MSGLRKRLKEVYALNSETIEERPEVERLQARVKQFIDEALADGPMSPAQLRQAVIRQLALDLDPSNEPDIDLIQAEVREVRRARARRNGQ